MEILTKTLAKDVMTQTVISVPPSMSVRQLAQIFLEREITGAPVVEEGGKVVGFVSQTDIVEFELYLQSDNSIESRMEETGGYVQDIMAPVESFARETDSLATILDKMCSEKIHRLIVLDEQGNLAGIVTTMDVMCWLQRLSATRLA